MDKKTTDKKAEKPKTPPSPNDKGKSPAAKTPPKTPTKTPFPAGANQPVTTANAKKWVPPPPLSDSIRRGNQHGVMVMQLSPEPTSILRQAPPDDPRHVSLSTTQTVTRYTTNVAKEQRKKLRPVPRSSSSSSDGSTNSKGGHNEKKDKPGGSADKKDKPGGSTGKKS